MAWEKMILTAALVWGLVAPASAATPAGITRCLEKTGDTTVGMLDCISAETKVQDARLNKAYKNLVAELSPQRRAALLEAQRAWIKFRDTNCGFYYDPDGGTEAAVESSQCVLDATVSRAKELEFFLSQ